MCWRQLASSLLCRNASVGRCKKQRQSSVCANQDVGHAPSVVRHVPQRKSAADDLTILARLNPTNGAGVLRICTRRESASIQPYRPIEVPGPANLDDVELAGQGGLERRVVRLALHHAPYGFIERGKAAGAHEADGLD